MEIPLSPSLNLPPFIPYSIELSHLSLLSLSQPNRALLKIINRVPPPQERITQNRQWADWLREIHAHKRANTRSLDLKNIVISTDAEILSANLERDIWELITFSAINSVLSIPALLGAHLGVKELGEGRWQSDEGGSGIEDNAGVLKLSGRVAEGNGVEVDLPVRLATEWEISEVAGETVIVDTAKDGLGFIAFGVGVTEVECEDLLVEEALVDHVVEGWDDLVHADGVEAETQDTVETAEGEGQSWLFGGLGEVLTLDGEITDREVVVGDEALHGARAVVDLEARSIRLVGLGCGRIVLGVQVAGDATALLGWDPEVGGAGIKNNLEGLWWVTEGDLGEV